MFKKYLIYSIIVAMIILIVVYGNLVNNHDDDEDHDNDNKGFLKKYKSTIMSEEEIKNYVKPDNSYIKINGKNFLFNITPPGMNGIASPDENQIQMFVLMRQKDKKKYKYALFIKALPKEQKFEISYGYLSKGDFLNTHKGILDGKIAANLEDLEVLLELDKLELKHFDKRKKPISIEFSLSQKAIIPQDSASISLKSNKEILITGGDLGKNTYKKLKKLLNDNPNVTTIILGNVDGSIDDKINVETGRMIRKKGLNTKVLSDSDIASGGVDLFASGVERIYTRGAKIGVHSWCCGNNGETADLIPKDNKSHYSQLGYFTTMLPKTGYDFYFYTLKSAPFNNIYYMKESELKKYKVITKILD